MIRSTMGMIKQFEITKLPIGHPQEIVDLGAIYIDTTSLLIPDHDNAVNYTIIYYDDRGPVAYTDWVGQLMYLNNQPDWINYYREYWDMFIMINNSPIPKSEDDKPILSYNLYRNDKLNIYDQELSFNYVDNPIRIYRNHKLFLEVDQIISTIPNLLSIIVNKLSGTDYYGYKPPYNENKTELTLRTLIEAHRLHTRDIQIHTNEHRHYIDLINISFENLKASKDDLYIHKPRCLAQMITTLIQYAITEKIDIEQELRNQFNSSVSIYSFYKYYFDKQGNLRDDGPTDYDIENIP